MSDFSDVDASARVTALVSYLDATDTGLAAMKAYMAAAAARALGNGVIIDLGCGVGHDLIRLAGAGARPIGVDSSVEMLARCRERCGSSVPLTRADGAQLPFARGSLDGCRMERVLQHVDAPEAVVAELARVLRPGGFLAVFEPDYTTFRVQSDGASDESIPARFVAARHPAIGGQLVALLQANGFRIDDVVTESSRGYSLARLPANAATLLQRAVADGRLPADAATRWLEEQEARLRAGTFRASWDKVLVVASRDAG